MTYLQHIAGTGALGAEIDGATYVDIGERGVLRWSGIPLDVYEKARSLLSQACWRSR